MENNAPTFYTAKALSQDYFKGLVSYKAVLEMTRKGQLPAVRSGKKYIYMKDAVDKWVAKNFNTPAWAKLKVV